MPKQMTKVTTVYTLEELKELPADKKGTTPYERAIEKIIESNNDGFYIQWLSEDLQNWMNDGPGKFSEGEYPFDSGEKDEWDYDHRWVTITIGVYVADYMKREKLVGKNRTLYNYLRDVGDDYISAKIGTLYNRGSRCAPLPAGTDIDVTYGDRWKDKAWLAKAEAQAETVLQHIAGQAQQVLDKLLKWIVDDIDYRYSEEFAKEEAEAQEWVFTAYGSIYSE